jgi:prepilin peptidase CpaA
VQPAVVWATAVSVLLIIGAGTDIAWRKLPNLLCLGLAAIGLAWAFWEAGSSAPLLHVLHGLAALAPGMVLFRFGWIGGGDAKFYAGLASNFVIGKAMLLLLAVAGTGLVLVLLWIAWRRILGKKISRTDGDEAKFPYGVPIAVAGAALIWV